MTHNRGSVGLPLATGEPALWPPPFADYALIEVEWAELIVGSSPRMVCGGRSRGAN
jgi:hypothetical protein